MNSEASVDRVGTATFRLNAGEAVWRPQTLDYSFLLLSEPQYPFDSSWAAGRLGGMESSHKGVVGDLVLADTGRIGAQLQQMIQQRGGSLASRFVS